MHMKMKMIVRSGSRLSPRARAKSARIDGMSSRSGVSGVEKALKGRWGGENREGGLGGGMERVKGLAICHG
jgi:hypothetical protein